MLARNVIIIGAAGRDFHNFNVLFRDNEDFRVKAFTAAQIPDIDGRKYPLNWQENYTPKEFPSTTSRNFPN
jgi:predicted GTPase